MKGKPNHINKDPTYHLAATSASYWIHFRFLCMKESLYYEQREKQMSRTNMILSQHLSSVSHALKHLWRPSAKVKVGDKVDKDEVANRLEATMLHLRMPDTLHLLSTAPDSLCT